MSCETYCSIKTLSPELLIPAAQTAVEENPANRPPVEQMLPLMLPMLALDGVDVPQRIAVMTSKYWSNKGVDLTVGFMEPTAVDLRERILSHMNVWGTKANVRFRWTQSSPQVRITRNGDGYWSYLGTDVLHIAANEATMCLQGFTMSTSEAEFRRVVRHETGHTLGCPHEHMRSSIIARLDEAKTIAWGRSALGWNEQMVRSQILTPISESQFVIATPTAEQDSIMCYQLPASITKDGQPIVGGADVTASDATFIGKAYPLAINPPKPPDPTDPPTPPNPPTGVDVMAILAKLKEILDAFQAKQWFRLFGLVMELIRLLGVASASDMLQVEQALTGGKAHGVWPSTWNRAEFRGTMWTILSIAKLAAQLTIFTSKDDLTVEVLSEQVEDDAKFARLCDLLGIPV